MKTESLHELYIEQLRDLYDAETQLVRALPKLAEAANSEELRSGFEKHLEQTKGHVQRLEEIFQALGEKPTGEKCKGMEGLIKEGSELAKEDMDEDVKDAGLIASAQRVEHYEIAGYGTVRTYANLLGFADAEALLEQTLDEEKETDRKLTELAEEINIEAKAGADSEATTSQMRSSKNRGRNAA